MKPRHWFLKGHRTKLQQHCGSWNLNSSIVTAWIPGSMLFYKPEEYYIITEGAVWGDYVTFQKFLKSIGTRIWAITDLDYGRIVFFSNKICVSIGIPQYNIILFL